MGVLDELGSSIGVVKKSISVVVVTRAGEGTPQLADLTPGLVNGDNVACLHLTRLQALDHVRAQV